MNYRKTEKVPFINISNSHSDSSNRNDFSHPKISIETYTPLSKKIKCPLSLEKNHLLSLNNELCSLSCSSSNISKRKYKKDKNKSKINQLKSKNKIIKKSLEKMHINIKNTKQYFNIFSPDIEIIDKIEKNKYYTPKKTANNYNYNIINKNKFFYGKTMIYSNVNYQPKNLIGIFKQIKSDTKENNLGSNKKLISTQKSNNFKVFSHEFKLNKPGKTNILKLNKFNFSNKIKHSTRNKIFFNDFINMSDDKNAKEYSKKEEINNLFNQFGYKHKKIIIKKINNRIVNKNKKCFKSLKQKKRISKSDNEYKAFSKSFNKVYYSFTFNMMKNMNN